MVTIIHLSDLHIRKGAERRDNRNAEHLVHYLVGRYGHRPRESTFVIVTGDLVHSITRRHYENLVATVLTPLQEKFRVLTVPGNHDYARMGHFFDPSGPPLFAEFVDGRRHPVVDDARSPDRYHRGQGCVRLIGLDTADKDDRVFLANGVLDERQVHKLKGLLAHHERDFLVVYLHHHPFNRNPFTAFRRYRRFLDTIQGKVNLILFGHKHVSAAFFDRCGVPLMLAAGKATQSHRGALSFRVIRLNTKVDGFGEGLRGVRFYTEEIPAAPFPPRRG
ncbi:MAG: metallophosphoesterase [Candidatus Hydrogenedentes bacterium]|nr:metallophosphoesterase [Candidatus Hydrogenedentota bacterium]